MRRRESLADAKAGSKETKSQSVTHGKLSGLSVVSNRTVRMPKPYQRHRNCRRQWLSMNKSTARHHGAAHDQVEATLVRALRPAVSHAGNSVSGKSVADISQSQPDVSEARQQQSKPAE